jgi:uncharacterized protein YhhL (DUF1145 family)
VLIYKRGIVLGKQKKTKKQKKIVLKILEMFIFGVFNLYLVSISIHSLFEVKKASTTDKSG